MDKKGLHHIWTKLRLIRPRYFFAIFILSSAVAVLALRHNNQTMIRLRNNVYQADKDNGDVRTALQSLQAYVTAHMNTDLASGPNAVYPPIQLKYTYERLQQTQLDQVNASNSQLYTDAQNFCQGQNSTDFSGRNRVPCIEQYVTSHGAHVASIPASLYQFAFVSPKWSPDIAGWSLVVAILSGLLWILTWLVDRWFKNRVS